MKLDKDFIKLPYHFDATRLQSELDMFDKKDWVPHHQDFKGNFSIPLISVQGKNNNFFKGPMFQTETLKKCPYIKQVMACFGEILGRSRLMGLAPGAEVPLHSDINYYWYKRVRVHIPIITDPNVLFYCGESCLHMAEGEAWIFNSWNYHKVVNNSDIFRVHLVFDLSGSSRFWNLVNSSLVDVNRENRTILFDPERQFKLETEYFGSPPVMSPGEIEGLITDLIMELKSYKKNQVDDVACFIQILKEFVFDWRQLWSLYGQSKKGWSLYHQLRRNIVERSILYKDKLHLKNGTSAIQVLIHCIVDPSLTVELKELYMLEEPCETNIKDLGDKLMI